jgi:hypothetical protein
MDSKNVRVIQSRRSERFLFEAPQPVFISSERCGQQFDRDLPIHTSVTRAIDLTHPARAERREYFVRAESSLFGECHSTNSNFIEAASAEQLIPLLHADFDLIPDSIGDRQASDWGVITVEAPGGQ